MRGSWLRFNLGTTEMLVGWRVQMGLYGINRYVQPLFVNLFTSRVPQVTLSPQERIFCVQVENQALPDSVDELWVENSALWQQITELQMDMPSQVLCPTSPYEPKPMVLLLEHYEGTRSKLQGFMNQCRLYFLLWPNGYRPAKHDLHIWGWQDTVTF